MKYKKSWFSKFNIGDEVVYDGEKYIVISVAFWEGFIEYQLHNDFYALEHNLSFYIEPPIKEMTVNEIEELLGYKVKVVGD
jgi:hypothetical protein